MKNFFKENNQRLKMVWNEKTKKWEFQIHLEPKQKENLKEKEKQTHLKKIENPL